ncbi:hypothetical protein [Salmon gill poxvirus]|nr:hypothetical protein [Salmon gill poxvirus]
MTKQYNLEEVCVDSVLKKAQGDQVIENGEISIIKSQLYLDLVVCQLFHVIGQFSVFTTDPDISGQPVEFCITINTEHDVTCVFYFGYVHSTHRTFSYHDVVSFWYVLWNAHMFVYDVFCVVVWSVFFRKIKQPCQDIRAVDRVFLDSTDSFRNLYLDVFSYSVV